MNFYYFYFLFFSLSFVRLFPHGVAIDSLTGVCMSWQIYRFLFTLYFRTSLPSLVAEQLLVFPLLYFVMVRLAAGSYYTF